MLQCICELIIRSHVVRVAGFWLDLMDNYREEGNVSARQINSLHSRTVSVMPSRQIE